MADLNDAAEPYQGFFVDLVTINEFPVITEIAQEPTQFPQRFGSAIEPAGDAVPGELGRFEDRKSQRIEGLLGMPAVLRPFHAKQEETVRNSISQLSRLMEALDSALHVAPSLLPR